MSSDNELAKAVLAVLALIWLPIAFVVYCVAFGAGMLKVAARDGWGEFK